MKIKDVEQKVGISKANIRFYEEEGLITPDRNENNYREYSDADVELLKEIKKLRLLGIPVQDIKEIYEEKLPLQEALAKRLDEIEKEERTLKETKLTCQKAIKSRIDIESIDQLKIEEEREEWQVRLAILLKEDIVQKKLSRDELNNEIACFFFAGTIVSVLFTWLLPENFIRAHMFVGLLSLAAVIGLLIAGACSSNMRVHLALLFAGAVVQPAALFELGILMGENALISQSQEMLKCYILWLYGGTFILVVALWMGSKMNKHVLKNLWVSLLASLLVTGGSAGLFVRQYGAGMSEKNMIVTGVCTFIYLASVSGSFTSANADWKAYNRYHAVYTANKMINVLATIYGCMGYYGRGNWRR